MTPLSTPLSCSRAARTSLPSSAPRSARRCFRPSSGWKCGSSIRPRRPSAAARSRLPSVRSMRRSTRLRPSWARRPNARHAWPRSKRAWRWPASRGWSAKRRWRRCAAYRWRLKSSTAWSSCLGAARARRVPALTGYSQTWPRWTRSARSSSSRWRRRPKCAPPTGAGRSCAPSWNAGTPPPLTSARSRRAARLR